MRCNRLAALLAEVRAVVTPIAVCGDSESSAAVTIKKVIGLSSHLAKWKRMFCSLDLLYRILTLFCSVRARCYVALNYCEALFNSMLKNVLY